MRRQIALLVALALIAVGLIPVAASAKAPMLETPIQLERRASPPNVVGLILPVASERLRAAGWIPKPFNTDTLFGIVVPSHYTVCHQYRPIGKKVRLLAQKYGC